MVNKHMTVNPQASRENEVTASEAKAALWKAADCAPELAPLLIAARDVIVRLETEKREALFSLYLKYEPKAHRLLKREAAVPAPVVSTRKGL